MVAGFGFVLDLRVSILVLAALCTALRRFRGLRDQRRRRTAATSITRTMQPRAA